MYLSLSLLHIYIYIYMSESARPVQRFCVVLVDVQHLVGNDV